MYAPGRIRIRDSSKRAVADTRLRTRGHRDWQIVYYYEERAVMLPTFRDVAGFGLIPGCIKNFNMGVHYVCLTSL